MRFMKPAGVQLFAVAEDIPAMLPECLTELIDDFRALSCFLGGINPPRIRNENLPFAFGYLCSFRDMQLAQTIGFVANVRVALR
jgi:hypothetical protein